jgi:hypothetical protein
MISTRRSFLTSITGVTAAWPWRTGRSEAPSQSAHNTAPSTATAETPPRPEFTHPEIDLWLEPWLDSWQSLPRVPLVRDQIPLLGTARSAEWHRAIIITSRIREARDYDFIYHGGSQPATRRNVLPVLLFTTPPTSNPPDLTREPIYLLAHCLKRKAVRTFRLDRISQ